MSVNIIAGEIFVSEEQVQTSIEQVTVQVAEGVDVTDNSEVSVVEVAGEEIRIITSEMESGEGITSHNRSYIHLQASPSVTWIVKHNLSRFPSVSVVNSAGTLVMGDVHYDSIEQITLTFTTAFSGKAYIN